MKFYIKASSSYGYLYIFKHGVGPGTLPKDVTVNRVKDLPNGYTAVWTDRFLTTEELLDYDIPYETEINRYLNQVGYCQKNGDVVPCDDIEGCDKITASYDEDDYTQTNLEIAKKYEPILNKNGYNGSDFVKYVEEEYDYFDLRESDELRVAIWNFVVAELEDENAADDVTDKILNSAINACGTVEASTFSDIELLAREALECDTKEALGAVISGLDSLGLRKLFLHYMEMLRDDSLSAGYIASDLSDTLYNMINIDGCDKVDACGDQKYFANMVSASIDDDYDDEFLVEGYYDNQYRGLAESAETSDVSALNEYINDYANRGYFIKVHNLTDGTITEFSADNWFNDIVPDGGAELFMTW